MRKPLMGALGLLVGAWALGAQEASVQVISGRDAGIAASAFPEMRPASANLLRVVSDASMEGGSVQPPAANAVPAEPAGEPPAAKPKYVFFGNRDDYRWQLGLGVEFFRFQSNVIDASLVGLNTTVTYFTNSWFALEGNMVTGFAPQIYDREHVKLFGGGGGIRIGGRRAQWEPWAHAVVGGAHLQPQTAGSSRNSLMAQTGIGLDYRVNGRLSLRAQGDWVYTEFFGQTQNNFQGVAGAVLHF
jgi:hypothetical protein